MSSDDKKQCFVITPIGSADSPVRRKIDGLVDEVIKPVMNELGYEVKVSHKINDSGTMTSTIIKSVYECDLAIANLTGNNPNVMYEVAIRHAAGKPIIHITEDINNIPFDINDQRIIEYSDDMAGAQELKNNLKKMVEGIDFSIPSNNPIMEALAKTNIIEVPEEKSVDIAEALTDLRGEISILKQQINTLNKPFEVPYEDMLMDNMKNRLIASDYDDSFIMNYIKQKDNKIKLK